MKRLFNPLLFATLFFASFLLASCKGDEPIPPIEPDPEPETETTLTTLLVYMVADNSLGAGGFDIADLQEIGVAVNNGVLDNNGRILVYHNRPGTAQGLPPVLVEFTPEGVDTLVVYPDDKTLYSTDLERMREVLQNTIQLAPAKNFGIVFWSHSSGWISESTARNVPVKRSFGLDRTRRMAIPTLAEALSGFPISFIYFDSCHMGTIEVAYELRNVTPVIVASPAEIPANGMPYDITLPYFLSENGPDPVGAAQATFHHYNSMVGEERTSTLAAYSTANLDALADAVRAIMLRGQSLPKPVGQYQNFMRYSNTLYDLKEYINSLALGDNDPLIAQFNAALDDAVIWADSTPTIFNRLYINHYCGFSTYIVTNVQTAADKGYMSLSWWTDVVSANPLFSL